MGIQRFGFIGYQRSRSSSISSAVYKFTSWTFRCRHKPSLVAFQCRSISSDSKERRCFIALGSNMAGRLGPIEKACRAIEQLPGTKLVRSSHLWNTKAQYVEDQEDFLNGVCEIKTTLEPLDLLDALQGIENNLGRVKLVDKGPRNIDLDILLYEDLVMDTERLTIPHKLMLERDFVLRPLCELIYDEEHPKTKQRYHLYLNKINQKDQPAKLAANPLTFLSQTAKPLAPYDRKRQTRIMSILNFTPDSFSDGGKHSPMTPSDSFTPQFLENSDIFDIGGESTRPGSTPVTAEEELDRILPAVKNAASVCSPAQTISVDTYHASVAEAALQEGAHIINDISAGRLDKDMFRVVAKHDATIVLMHSRGTPQTMMQKKHLDHGDYIHNSIGKELLERVKAAEAAGVRPWRIILDAGFGFSKNSQQNMALLRGLHRLKTSKEVGLYGYPWCIGTSRKKFIRELAGTSEVLPLANNVALTLAIAEGADIVRVHDPLEAKSVARITDSLWRRVDGS